MAPRNAYAVSHPSAPLEPTNKKYRAPFLLSISPVITRSKAKYRPFAWHGMSLVSEATCSSQNCSRSPGWPSASNPLRICGKPISPEPYHVLAHFARRKSSGLDLLYLHNSSPSLASSCRSLVSCFRPD